MSEEKEVLLELTSHRTIVLHDRGKTYSLNCRRITTRDWKQYFSGIVITSQKDGKEIINVIDVTSPRLALAEAVLTGAEGYKVAGDAKLSDIPNWQKRIPLSHRLQLGETLADVRPSKADTELVIHPEAEEVMLDATWTANLMWERGTAPEPRFENEYFVQRFVGLKHVLKSPTEAQQKRFTREASRSTVVGGSRNGKTVYQGAQPLLADLYDELVISVDGYAVNGEPLTSPDQIIREMDMLHKVIAAQEIFQPQQTATLDAGEDQ